jgi:hypothetical protein
MRFVQADNIKAKNGGKGILESMIGIDYLSLGINKDYEPMPTKPEYTAKTGNCAGGTTSSQSEAKNIANC